FGCFALRLTLDHPGRLDDRDSVSLASSEQESIQAALNRPMQLARSFPRPSPVETGTTLPQPCGTCCAVDDTAAAAHAVAQILPAFAHLAGEGLLDDGGPLRSSLAISRSVRRREPCAAVARWHLPCVAPMRPWAGSFFDGASAAEIQQMRP